MLICTPFQDFGVASFHDLESEEVLAEPLDTKILRTNQEHDDIDDIIHIGRWICHKDWFHFDGNPIYDVNDGSRIK